jgi:hypothetical protein
MVGSLRTLRWKRVYYWAVVVVLAVTGFISTQLSFAPFRLGWMSWLISAGMAMLTPFLVDRLLEGPGMERALKVLTAVTATASLVSLMLLALIRGNIMAEQIRNSETQAVVIDDAAPQSQAPDTFYDRSTSLLSVALLLMAFAAEIGGGLVLHQAWRSMPDDAEDWGKLRRELVEVRGQMAEIVRQVTALRNAPQVFEARYWRDFYRALLLNATRNAMTKLLMVFLTVLFFAGAKARAEVHLDLVVAIDLTRSVAAVGPDGKSDFQKNVEGVSRVLAQIPAGARISIIGITDHSFAEPYILMQARVPDDSGYFGERLKAARGQIVGAWQKRAAHLNPDFKQTDIFGALALASQLFAQSPGAERKELVIFSDMRESMPGFDFEHEQLLPLFSAMAGRCGQMPALTRVQVSVAGVDGAGKSMSYWQSLKRFWAEYFVNTGAALRDFTNLRDISLASASADTASRVGLLDEKPLKHYLRVIYINKRSEIFT